MKWVDLLNLLWRIKTNKPGAMLELGTSNWGAVIPSIIRLQKAIILFTGANVASVKDPSLFNPQLANNSFEDIWKEINSGPILPFSFGHHHKHFKNIFKTIPTKKDYQDAHNILMELSSEDLSKSLSFHTPTPNLLGGPDKTPDTIYRMIHLSWKEGMDLLNPSTTHGDFGRPVSTSYERRQTLGFSSSTSERVSLLFEIKHRNRGVYVSEFSVFNDEKEVISGGKYKINNIEVTYIEGGTVDSGIGVDRQTAFDVFMKVYYGTALTPRDVSKLSKAELLMLTRLRNKILFPNLPSGASPWKYQICFIVECELI